MDDPSRYKGPGVGGPIDPCGTVCTEVTSVESDAWPVRVGEIPSWASEAMAGFEISS